MKTKIKHTRLLAVILTLVFIFCAAMPLTAYAAPEDGTTSSSTETTTPAESETPAENNPPAENEKKAPDGATPPYFSTGNIVENVRQNNPDATGLQFVIFKTASDKVFYLVIDFDKESDNVYLLTEVGENDLLNFVEVDENGNPVNQPQNNSSGTQQNPGQKTETPAQNNNIGLIVIVIAVLGIGGAAFYFFKGKKGNNKPLKAADFDFEDDEVEYDEPTVNEDDASTDTDDE